MMDIKRGTCKPYRVILSGCFFVAASSGEPRMFMVPQGQDPTDYSNGPTILELRQWESVTLDIMVTFSEPLALRAVLITLDEARGGEVGSLMLTGARVDQARPDYPSEFPSQFVTAEGPPFQFGSVSTSEPVMIGPNDTIYVGEATYEARFAPCGTFPVEFVNPGTHENADTLLSNPDIEFIPFHTEQTFIHVSRAGGYGDVNVNNTVDIEDIFCILDGFQGAFPNCPFEELDIAGCKADGVIDINDIFAVLDAFQGTQPCVPWCGPPGDE